MLQLNYSLFALSYYVVTVNNIMHFSNGSCCLIFFFSLCYFLWPDYSFPLAHPQWFICLQSPSKYRRLNSYLAFLVCPSDEIMSFCGHFSSRSASEGVCCYFIDIIPGGLVITVLCGYQTCRWIWISFTHFSEIF